MICPHCGKTITPHCPLCAEPGSWIKGRRAANGTRYYVYSCSRGHRFVAANGATAKNFKALRRTLASYRNLTPRTEQ